MRSHGFYGGGSADAGGNTDREGLETRGGQMQNKEAGEQMTEFERLLEHSSLGSDEADTPIRTELVHRVIARAKELSDARYAIGIELLPYRLVGVVTDDQGMRLIDGQRRLHSMSFVDVVSAVVELIRELMDATPEANPAQERIALAMQLGGPVNSATGTVL